MRIKRLTAILLCLCMALTLLPATAWAADGETIHVGGVTLTGSADTPAYAKTDNSGNVTVESAREDDYNLKWDGTTLTLKTAGGVTEFDGTASEWKNFTFPQNGEYYLTIRAGRLPRSCPLRYAKGF